MDKNESLDLKFNIDINDIPEFFVKFNELVENVKQLKEEVNELKSNSKPEKLVDVLQYMGLTNTSNSL